MRLSGYSVLNFAKLLEVESILLYLYLVIKMTIRATSSQLGFDMLTLSTIYLLYHGGQFYCWRKPEYPEKNTDLLQVTYHFVT